MKKPTLFDAVVSCLAMCAAAWLMPEPGSIVLVAAGLLGLLLWRAAEQQRAMAPAPVPKQRPKSGS